MPFPFHSLKTSVMAHLAFLILSAMLLMNGVMIKVAENHLIQSKMQAGRLLLEALTGMVRYEIARRNKPLNDLGTDARLKTEMTRLLESGNYSGAMILNGLGVKIFATDAWQNAEKASLSIGRETLSTRQLSFAFSGTAWGVIWLVHEQIHMAAPIFIDGRLVGAATVGASLRPLYQNLRETEGFSLIYIFLNTVVLGLFGAYLLSRVVVKPIQKLVHITEDYKDVDSIPVLGDGSSNEIGQLSRSLNNMIMRLDQNEKELKQNISYLETANNEIKKAQNEIINSEKLASVGRLATGVAHEIGNPIGIVLGYLELLKEVHLTQTEREDFLDRMESEITRINQIIRDLLDFSRTPSGRAEAVSVHGLITETLDMLKPQPMMTQIQMNPLLQASRDVVRADPNQLKQVFLNLIMNAADAMGEKGPDHNKSDNHMLTIQTENSDHGITLRFMDRGPGIEPEALVRIFDPFYTTKAPGKGTGLGLSVCYNIISRLGGDIRAESTPGKGTTVVIRIPLVQEDQVHLSD